MIAHLWKVSKDRWMVELAKGTTVTGFTVVGVSYYETRAEAVAAVACAGALPWNF